MGSRVYSPTQLESPAKRWTLRLRYLMVVVGYGTIAQKSVHREVLSMKMDAETLAKVRRAFEDYKAEVDAAPLSQRSKHTYTLYPDMFIR